MRVVALFIISLNSRVVLWSTYCYFIYLFIEKEFIVYATNVYVFPYVKTITQDRFWEYFFMYRVHFTCWIKQQQKPANKSQCI